MFKKLKYYFISGALAKAKDIFEKAQVELSFNVLAFTMILWTLYLFQLASMESLSMFWVNLTVLVVILAAFIMLRITGSIKWLVVPYVLAGMGGALVYALLFGGQLPMVDGLWDAYSIVFAFMVLGRKWGFAITIYLSVLILLVALSRISGWGLFNIEHPLDLALLDDPIGLMTPIGLLAYTVFYFIRTRNRAQLLILQQKNKIEETHKEITDSIAYAKRIQGAILPTVRTIREHLNESFVLYKPKDVVAGDFYWTELNNGMVLFAAADCTGHGVPGALVSMVCNNALNRSVREYDLSEPGKILDKAREIVIQEFDRSDEEVKDGMDIALCSIKDYKLEYAGAHIPLWIISQGEVIETKADKQPIGKFDNSVPFTTHSIDLQKSDVLYIFSDGYVDQFGGPEGKKFKSRAFKELLLSIHDKPMDEQKQLLDETIDKWRGPLEQVDDICIIGVRI